MRIRELSLIRYGHFEDTSLSFPRDEHDIHVVYGENEAGKSTALRALGDVLFEFPARTPMAFRFPMPKLRIGATLELDDEVFEFVRYKKRLDSIKDIDGNDILDGEKTLKRYLANGDRELFERLFLLDHDRLQAGTRELLAGGGDAGEAMLASSAGLEGLHDLLDQLNAETDGLWAPAASKKRQFYIAKDALDAAVRERKEHTVEPREWKRAHQAVEFAREQYAQMVEELRDKRAERSRLDRIRRLWGDLTRLVTAEQELAELEEPVLLDEGAVELLRQARTEFNAIQGRIENHQGHVEKLQAGIAELPIDEALLSRADDLEALNERRVSLRQYGEDLPRRRITRTTLEERIGTLARDLGWSDMDASAVAEQLPTKPLVDRARGLVVEHTKLTTERAGLAAKQKDTQREQNRLAATVKNLAAAVDPTDLVAAIATADKQRSLSDERRRLETEVQQRTALLEQTLRPMSPSFADEGQLAAALLPDRAAVSVHRDAYRACHSTLKELRDDARKLAQQMESEREEIEAERKDIGVMSEADLQAARATRDDAWGLLATRYLHGAQVDRKKWQALFGEDASGEQRYPALVEAADEGADLRFTHAHEVGALATKEAARAKMERDLVKLRETIEAREAEEATLKVDWDVLWQGCPVNPSDPDNGVAWHEQAMRCKVLLDELATKRATLASVRECEDGACGALRMTLSTFVSSGQTLEERNLEELIELGKETGRTLRSNNDARANGNEALDTATAALAEANDVLAAQDTTLGQWQSKWDAVLKSLGLDANTTPGELDSYLGVIEELRDKARELVDNINDRIEKMEGALSRFSEDVRSLADALANTNPDAEPSDLVTSLVARLRQCQSHAEQRERDTKAIAEEQQAIEDLQDAQRDHRDTIERLAKLAGTTNEEDLTRAASNSDRRRELAATVETLVAAIEKNGDGKPLAELQNEATDVDLDAANARAQQLDEEIEALDDLFPERRDALTTAEKALESIGTDAGAARSESARQQALADMGEVAERYVRTATASALLRWSIDRFRIQNQKPLLDRASQLFGLLTRSSFERIVIEFDAEEQPVLAGRRPSGEIISLEGLSSGSQDQLFLALRLAAVDDYAAKASAMPFVGDDLFIRHDENRTREALEALTDLSKTCQVILFSHSRAFLSLAKETLPDRTNVIELEPLSFNKDS